ncbi:MAG: cupin domain-containing protein [Flavobacteriaceae bacterium]
MKLLYVLVGALCLLGIGYYFGISTTEPDLDDASIATSIFQRAKAKHLDGNWGTMDIYTDFETRTHGTERMFTALTEVMPGEALHPAHRHYEEEFLLVTKGNGVWSLNGESIVANTGDLLYVKPWEMHGLTNTGKDTLNFFVIRWNSKGQEKVPEPEGDHGE